MRRIRASFGAGGVSFPIAVGHPLDISLGEGKGEEIFIVSPWLKSKGWRRGRWGEVGWLRGISLVVTRDQAVTWPRATAGAIIIREGGRAGKGVDKVHENGGRRLFGYLLGPVHHVDSRDPAKIIPVSRG